MSCPDRLFRLNFESGVTVTLVALLATLWIALTAAGTTLASPCYDCERYARKHASGSPPLTDPYGLVSTYVLLN